MLIEQNSQVIGSSKNRSQPGTLSPRSIYNWTNIADVQDGECHLLASQTLLSAMYLVQVPPYP